MLLKNTKYKISIKDIYFFFQFQNKNLSGKIKINTNYFRIFSIYQVIDFKFDIFYNFAHDSTIVT